MIIGQKVIKYWNKLKVNAFKQVELATISSKQLRTAPIHKVLSINWQKDSTRSHKQQPDNKKPRIKKVIKEELITEDLFLEFKIKFASLTESWQNKNCRNTTTNKCNQSDKLTTPIKTNQHDSLDQMAALTVSSAKDAQNRITVTKSMRKKPRNRSKKLLSIKGKSKLLNKIRGLERRIRGNHSQHEQHKIRSNRRNGKRVKQG